MFVIYARISIYQLHLYSRSLIKQLIVLLSVPVAVLLAATYLDNSDPQTTLSTVLYTFINNKYV